MSGEIDVRHETLHAVGLLLRERASSLSALRSLGPGPDAGETSDEVDRVLRQIESTAESLVRRVSSMATRVDDSRDRYLEVDERVRQLLSGAGPAGD
jgi:hypothetical protein